eukprot:8141597-Pyramimonas_sp.AAC.1
MCPRTRLSRMSETSSASTSRSGMFSSWLMNGMRIRVYGRISFSSTWEGAERAQVEPQNPTISEEYLRLQGRAGSVGVRDRDWSVGEVYGTPVGVVYRAQGPALGSWEDQPPAASSRCVVHRTIRGDAVGPQLWTTDYTRGANVRIPGVTNLGAAEGGRDAVSRYLPSPSTRGAGIARCPYPSLAAWALGPSWQYTVERGSGGRREGIGQGGVGKGMPTGGCCSRGGPEGSGETRRCADDP